MGTSYYFARPDNRTLFDMEKAYGLREILRVTSREPVVQDDLLAALLLWYEGESAEAERVHDRIVEFAQGQPIYFVSEHDEAIDGDAYRDGGWLRIYDTRFGDEPWTIRYGKRKALPRNT